MFVEVIDQAVTSAVHLLPLDKPNIGNPKQPPGFDKIEDVLGWVKWLCLAVLIAALMATGAKMALGSRHGDGEEHAGRVGRVLVGTIIVSAAGALIGFFV